MPRPQPSDPEHLAAEELVEVMKALSNPVRLQIMQWLRDPEASFADYEVTADRRTVGICVTHLQDKAGLAQSTVSSYMSTLERAGLVAGTRVGKYTHYRRREDHIARLTRSLHLSI